MDREAISIAVVFNDEAVLNEYLRPSLRSVAAPVKLLELNNTDNAVSTNIASIYNVLLGLEGPDIVAILHPDVAFDESFVEDLLSAVETLEREGKPWGAIGIVGRTWEGKYLWCHEVDAPAAVCSLDSCSLVTRRSLGVRFDQERFGEFHCYVEDYCLQAQARGLGVYVVPASARHGSATMKVKGAQWGNYRKYRRRLSWKWWRKFGRVYTC